MVRASSSRAPSSSYSHRHSSRFIIFLLPRHSSGVKETYGKKQTSGYAGDVARDLGHAGPANVDDGTAHGHSIARVIEQTSDDVLQVEQGSLPGLASSGRSRLGKFLLGRQRKQSQSQVLQADGKRPQAMPAETSRWQQMVKPLAGCWPGPLSNLGKDRYGNSQIFSTSTADADLARELEAHIAYQVDENFRRYVRRPGAPPGL